MGQELVDRVVEPLLGGVYAGRCEDLSFQATLAPLAAARPALPVAQRGGRLAAAAGPGRPGHADPAMSGPPPAGPARRPRPGGRQPGRPPSAAADGGPAGRRAAAGVHDAGGRARARCRRGWPRASGRRGPDPGHRARADPDWQHGWRLTVGSAHAPQWLDADAVILALPARPASRLLAGVPGAGAAAAALAEISTPAWP